MPGSTSVMGMQRAACLAIDDNAAIHFLLGNADPMPLEANFGALVGRAVEAFRKSAGEIGFDRRASCKRGRNEPA